MRGLELRSAYTWSKGDLEWVRQIKNTDFVQKFSEGNNLRSEEQQQEWYKRITESNNEKWFIIYDSSSVIGACCLDVNWVFRNAEFTIYLRENEVGKGFGSLALKELLSYGFNQVNLHKIWGKVFDYNKGAIALYEKLGFVKEADLKDHVFKDGKYRSVYIYSKFKE